MLPFLNSIYISPFILCSSGIEYILFHYNLPYISFNPTCIFFSLSGASWGGSVEVNEPSRRPSEDITSQFYLGVKDPHQVVLMSPIKEISNINVQAPPHNSDDDEDNQENLKPAEDQVTEEKELEAAKATNVESSITGGLKRPEVIAQQCLYPRSFPNTLSATASSSPTFQPIISPSRATAMKFLGIADMNERRASLNLVIGHQKQRHISPNNSKRSSPYNSKTSLSSAKASPRQRQAAAAAGGQGRRRVKCLWRKSRQSTAIGLMGMPSPATDNTG